MANHMRITGSTLPDMARCEVFIGTYTGYVAETLALARLFPKFAVQRVVEAHGAWQADVARVGQHEPRLSDGLDHFKQCGFLAFWLRRMSPMVDAVDLTENVGDAAGYALSAEEKEFREILFGYGNEYLAFDFGFQICRFYEISKDGGSKRAEELVLPPDYYQSLCHFMKYKNISPHAMYTIYRSLLA